MAESIIYTLPEEVRPEHIERYVVPLHDDGSLHLDNIHFRAHQGEETILPNGYLAIYGDRYNSLPGLFNVFGDDTQEDVWMRMTWLNSIKGQRAPFVATLVFSEWITDSYYSAVDIDTAPWGTNAIGICVNLYDNRASLGEPYSSEIINDFGTASNSSQAEFGSGLGLDPVIDLHVFRTGLNAFRGGNWSSEVYVDEILRFTSDHTSEGDIGHDLGRTGIGGMVFGTQYATYSSPSYIPIDNVMVGTSQDSEDLMGTATFEDDTFSPLNDVQNIDDGDGLSFEILLTD